ncbi:hypothetical protein MIMGU_mgv11b0193492mg, partial [Erythranthe guttata]
MGTSDILLPLSLLIGITIIPFAYGWGYDGHIAICRIAQPLHVGFTSDKGGNTIRVTWFTRKQVLHHVWDTDLIRTDEGGFNASLLNNFIKKIEQEITENKWRYQVNRWEACSNNQTTCPNIYAAESIKAACDWAYKG